MNIKNLSLGNSGKAIRKQCPPINLLKKEVDDMQKVFLSHSSADKRNYVSLVADKLIKNLGPENVILDELTFQEGRKTIEEIEDNLECTDLFVFFCSENSLKSAWVREELFKAEDLWNANKLQQICPIIIDKKIKYDDPLIPEWMQKNYNLQYISRPNKAAQIIQQRMIEISFERHPRLKERNEIFVGRNEQIKNFEERIDDFEKVKPICVVASGINSIGRKTLLKKCIIKSNIKKNSYPFSSISLNYDESIEDFILKLYDLGLTRELDIRDMMKQPIGDKIQMAVSIIHDIQDQNDILFIEDSGSIINHDGVVAQWFVDLLEHPQIKCQVTFCIVSKFRLKYFGDDVAYSTREKVFHFGVDELSKVERDGLLGRSLRFEGISLDLEDIRMLSGLLLGFPEQVFFTVSLIKEKGIDYVRKNTYEIVEYNNKKASVVVRDIEPDSDKISFLALLSGFDYISIKYIYDVVEGEKQYINYIDEFLSKSICEYIGVMKEYIRVNDTIKDYVVRNNFPINPRHKNNICQSVNIFLENLSNNEYDIPEYLFSLKEALLADKKIDAKYLLPSLYLKTMSDLYNRRKNKEVIVFADRALENEQYMDGRIVFEIRYLLCSALAKLKDSRFKEEVHKISGADYRFLYGFYYRQIGRFDKALEMINESLRLRPNFSKAKREKVQIYIGMQEYQAAKTLAAENYQNYSDNPYHIQAYFSCLIKSEKSKENSDVLLSLIKTLENINSDVSKEMTLRCRAQYEAFYNDDEALALSFINQAIDMNPSIQYARIVKFDICERFGLIDDMKEIIQFFRQPEYKVKYQNNIIIFESIIMAKEGDVEKATKYFMNSIRDYTDEAKDKFVIKLNKYDNSSK